MNQITRFAPSPTGFLHVGNLRTAILNYLEAKRTGGTFILRLDDTDKNRSTERYSDQIKSDLAWLGFEWDRCEKQSNRIQAYKSAAGKLKESGCLYECFETPEELELKRRRQLGMGKPPVYDRSSLGLSSKEKKYLRVERQSYWRFKLDQTRIEWEDGILGPVSIDAGSVSDPVLIRGDGQFLYTLASVVDDIEFNVDSVIRGSDHVTNTATQIQILNKLGSLPPSFSHHSLLIGANGDPLSKRMKHLSLLELRKMGIEPKAIFVFMSNLGTQKSFNSEITMEESFKNFKLGNFGATPTKFDFKNLSLFSQKFLMRLKLHEIEEDLNNLNIPKNMQSDFWDMARENIVKRSDLVGLWHLCAHGADPIITPEDRDFISLCRRLMPLPPRDENSWSLWIKSIKSETSRSGKRLFLPLRKALTGQENGPDMKKLFPLMQKIRF